MNFCAYEDETGVCYMCHWNGKCLDYERGYKPAKYAVPVVRSEQHKVEEGVTNSSHCC